MMLKVSEATPSQINYLVAKIEGVKFTLAQVYGLWSVVIEYNYRLYEPATDWAQGGPIIEREGITLTHQQTQWVAQTDDDVFAYGPTPLIAAMRCYVASRLGDSVNVPEELT